MTPEAQDVLRVRCGGNPGAGREDVQAHSNWSRRDSVIAVANMTTVKIVGRVRLSIDALPLRITSANQTSWAVMATARAASAHGRDRSNADVLMPA